MSLTSLLHVNQESVVQNNFVCLLLYNTTRQVSEFQYLWNRYIMSVISNEHRFDIKNVKNGAFSCKQFLFR